MKLCTIRVAACIAMMLSALVAYPHPQEILPSSHDDTEQLQQALSACTNPKSACLIRLGPGVFHTDVLLVKGFNGSIVGRGVGRTIIKPLETRELRSISQPFVTEPTLSQPYPILLHFANNSKVSLSRLTLDFTSAFAVQSYDLPYTAGVTNALVAAVQVDGDDKAELSMTKVSILGMENDSYFGSNVSTAVAFEGLVRTTTDGVDQTRKVQSGRVFINGIRIERGGIGVSIRDADHLRSLVSDNDVGVRIYGIYTEDLGASKISTIGNRVTADLEGILMAQSGLPPAVPSDYWVTRNRVRVNESGRAIEFDVSAYDGIGVFDYLEGSESIASNIYIWANDIYLADNVLAGVAIDSDGTGAVSVVGNRILGPVLDAGVKVSLSRGTFIARNDLRSVQPGVAQVHLLSTTRQCKVIQRGASVRDEGTDNRVFNEL